MGQNTEVDGNGRNVVMNDSKEISTNDLEQSFVMWQIRRQS